MHNRGFTLVESILTFALLAIMLTILGTAIYRTTQSFIETSSYANNDDDTYDTAQSVNDADNYETKYSLTGKAEMLNSSGNVISTNDKDVSTNLRIAINKNNKDSSISYSRLSGSLGTIFPYFNYDSTKSGWGQSSSQITDLNNYGVKSFEDLPGTNYSALDELNNNWGKWSFIGWSTTLIEYSNSGITYYLGKPDAASSQNNWQGLITKDNFENFENYYNSLSDQQKGNIKLYPTYMYSKDIPESKYETTLLGNANNTIRTNQDYKNIQALANKASELVAKEYSNHSSLEDTLKALGFNSTTSNALMSETGLEILHFRENGWPVLANNHYSNLQGGILGEFYSGIEGSTQTDRNKKKFYDIKRSKYFNIVKIGDGNLIDDNISNLSQYYQGGVYNGFLYHVFNDGIGFNLRKCGSNINYRHYLNMNYDYSSLMFGNSITNSITNCSKSMFFKVSENDGELSFTVYMGTLTSTGSVTNMGGSYTYTSTIHVS